MAIFYPKTLSAAVAPAFSFYFSIMLVCHYFSPFHKYLLFIISYSLTLCWDRRSHVWQCCLLIHKAIKHHIFCQTGQYSIKGKRWTKRSNEKYGSKHFHPRQHLPNSGKSCSTPWVELRSVLYILYITPIQVIPEEIKNRNFHAVTSQICSVISTSPNLCLRICPLQNQPSVFCGAALTRLCWEHRPCFNLNEILANAQRLDYDHYRKTYKLNFSNYTPNSHQVTGEHVVIVKPMACSHKVIDEKHGEHWGEQAVAIQKQKKVKNIKKKKNEGPVNVQICSEANVHHINCVADTFVVCLSVLATTPSEANCASWKPAAQIWGCCRNARFTQQHSFQ